MGVVDGSTPDGTVKYAGSVHDFPTPPKVAADADRRSLTINHWMSQFFNTTSRPVGHGFTQQGVIEGFACYSFHPVPGVPIKMIVIDDTDKTGSASGGPRQKAFGLALE